MDNNVTLRIQDLVPGKKYKRVGFNGQLGTCIYSVPQKVQINPENVVKNFRLFVGADYLLAATLYTEFVEVI